MRRRDFLLSLTTLPFLLDADPMWNGIIGSYVGETKFYLNTTSVRFSCKKPNFSGIPRTEDDPFLEYSIVGFSKFKDVSMGCKT